MKQHLLTGVAMAAALAIAAPVWAQNAPMTPSSPSASPPSAPASPPAAAMPKPAAPPTAAPSSATPTAPKPMAQKPVKKPVHRVSHRMTVQGDQMTEDLNKQELTRIQGGTTTAPMAPAPTPGGNNPTNGTAGPFAPSPGPGAPPPPK